MFSRPQDLMASCLETYVGASPQEIALCCVDQFPELLNQNLDDLVAMVQRISA